MAATGDLDDLYGLERSGFVPARDALARDLRSAGRREEAAAVKQARKPTLAAWALNQVARRYPGEVAALLRAGAALASEQEAALAGDAAGLREAGRALAEAVDRVGRLAAGLLDSSSPLQRERIANTLRAAATDTAGADLLRRGVLVEDLEAAGFGLPGGDAAAGAVPGAAPRGPSQRPPAPSRTGPSEAVDAARRDLRRLRAEADAAETRARRRAERAEAAARRAAEVHREAEAQRAEAEEAATEAVAARRAAEEAAARLAAVEGAGEGPGPDAT